MRLTHGTGTMRRLRTILVGCGAISHKHVAAIEENSESFELLGVHDIAQDRARQLAKEASCQSYTNPRQMAQDCQPEVVAIATPSSLHAEQAVFWLSRDAHLVLEKPVALSTRDIQMIEGFKRRSGQKIAVAYVSRFEPHIRILRKAIDAGRFGRIIHVGISIYLHRGEAYYERASWLGTWQHDGGTLMNQATHGIDLLQWIIGAKPTTIQSALARHSRRIETEDLGAAIVRFEDGSTATILATVDAYPTNLGTRLTILGDTGTVELTGDGAYRIETWRFPPDKNWESIDSAIASGALASEDNSMSGHSGVYQDLAKSITENRSPIADFESSKVSAELILGIYKAHRTGTQVEFPISFSTNDMVGTNL